MNAKKNSNLVENAVSYLHGRLEAQLEGFAASLGVPANELTHRVGSLLLAPSSREILGFAGNVSSLRRPSAKGNKVRKSEVAVARNTRSKPPRKKRVMSAEARRKIGEAQKKRWAIVRKAA